VQHTLPDRTEADFLYEVVLRLGIDLCVPVQSRQWRSKTVFEIGGGVLFACFDALIASSDVDGIAGTIIRWRQDLSPIVAPTCVFLDSAFEDDVAKLNLTAILEQSGISTVRAI